LDFENEDDTIDKCKVCTPAVTVSADAEDDTMASPTVEVD